MVTSKGERETLAHLGIGRVRRLDVASALEELFENNDWKGDNHYKGVFFTDQNGYCLNKVLAIRIAHEEEAPEVFYSFATNAIDEKVEAKYPYRDMVMKPKKHHLLNEREELKRRELDALFTIQDACDVLSIEADEVFGSIKEALPNKRERDRTQACFVRMGSGCRFEVVRNKKHEKEFLVKKSLVPKQYIFNEDSDFQRVARVNANSLYTVLHLFPRKSEVSFYISHDKMKITGNLSTLEGEKTTVEVVLAQMKG